MTFCQHDPSANAPWTRTAVLAFSWAAEAGRPIAATAARRRLKPTTLMYDFIATFLRFVGDLETQSPMFSITAGRLFGLKGVDQDLGGRSGRGRVLAGDQQPVGDDVDAPVFDLGEGGTEGEQLVLDEERHDLGQPNIRLLSAGEPGHLLALNSRLAPPGLYVPKDPPGH